MKITRLFDVYLHRCVVSGKGYVGITCRGVRNRLYSHESSARNGSSLPFHRAIRKYGISSFETTVLASKLPREEALSAEAHFIATLGTFGVGGYNATLGGDGTRGAIISNERRAQISKQMRELPRSEQHRRRCSQALKGRVAKPETLARMSAARKGVPQSEEHANLSRVALGKALEVWSGMKHTGESKTRMRAAKARVIVITHPDGRSTIERTTYRDLAERHGVSHSAIAQAAKLGRVITKQCGLQGCYISNFSHPQLLGLGVAKSTISRDSQC